MNGRQVLATLALTVGLLAGPGCSCAQWRPWPRPKPPAPAPAPSPAPQPPVNKRVPGGVPSWDTAYVGSQVPPGDNTPPIYSRNGRTLLKATNAWWQAVNDTAIAGAGKIELDYVRVYARMGDGSDRLVAAQEFNAGTTLGNVGSLFTRSPWVGGGGTSFSGTGATIANGLLTFDPSVRPNNVWHGWSTRGDIPAGAVALWTEARVRCTGSAAFQLGGDAMTSKTSPVDYQNGWNELGRSVWVWASAEFQVVRMGP